MPALLILAFISWLLGSGKPRLKAEPPLFTALEVRRRRLWPAIIASIAIHSLFVVFGLAISDVISDSDDEFVPLRAPNRALMIKLPEHIYIAPASRTFAATARPPKKPPLTSVRRKDLARFASSKPLQAPPPGNADLLPLTGPEPLLSVITPPAERVQAEPRKFQLPDLPERTTAVQTLLQADVPPNIPLPMDAKLPQLLFWDADKQKIKPPPEEAIQPGNLKAKLEPPPMNSTPRLEKPNHEARASDLSIASSPAMENPALPRDAGTTAPIRVLQPSDSQAQQNTSIDPFTGQPVHVLALSPDPAPLADALKALFIPAGNQLARLPGAPPMFGLSRTGSPQGSGSGAGADAGEGTGTEGAGGTGEGGDGDAELVHALPGDGRIFGLLKPPGLTGTPLRILHPSNGVFDVVVVQTSSSESFPDGMDALSGRPIYTVYLQVGAPKEWILQYCVPNTLSPLQSGNLVRLSNPAPIIAPYPMVTVRPPEDWRHGSDYLLIHGFLDRAGRFKEMTILPGRNPNNTRATALLQYLAFWEFRPAVQDGRPVQVEVILAVPPDRIS